MEKEIVRKLDDSSLKLIVPVDTRLIVQQIVIGAEKNYYSYNESIVTTSTGISGGGSRTSSYNSYNFGFAVANLSNISMRVQFHFLEIDKEGYTINNWYTWDDINAGEKRRFWSQFHITENLKFKNYILKEVAIGPTPKNGKKEGATWNAVYQPNKSIYDLFDLKSNPLVREPMSSETKSYWFLGIFLLVIAIILYLKIFYNGR